MTWPRHLRILLGTLRRRARWRSYLFVLAMNPYGNLPNTVLREHVMMDDNQRYQYPSVVRSGRYDSLIIGTSTSRLLDPRPFEAALGGRFANVAMNAGTAWEQTELTKLFLRHQPKPARARRRHRLGLVRARRRPRAHHLSRLSRMDVRRQSRGTTSPTCSTRARSRSRAAALAAAHSGSPSRACPPTAGRSSRRPSSDYDLAKAQAKIYGDGPRALPTPKSPPDIGRRGERAAWRFPALAWLDELIARAAGSASCSCSRRCTSSPNRSPASRAGAARKPSARRASPRSAHGAHVPR